MYTFIDIGIIIYILIACSVFTFCLRLNKLEDFTSDGFDIIIIDEAPKYGCFYDTTEDIGDADNVIVQCIHCGHKYRIKNLVKLGINQGDKQSLKIMAIINNIGGRT